LPSKTKNSWERFFVFLSLPPFPARKPRKTPPSHRNSSLPKPGRKGSRRPRAPEHRKRQDVAEPTAALEKPCFAGGFASQESKLSFVRFSHGAFANHGKAFFPDERLARASALMKRLRALEMRPGGEPNGVRELPAGSRPPFFAAKTPERQPTGDADRRPPNSANNIAFYSSPIGSSAVPTDFPPAQTFHQINHGAGARKTGIGSCSRWGLFASWISSAAWKVGMGMPPRWNRRREGTAIEAVKKKFSTAVRRPTAKTKYSRLPGNPWRTLGAAPSWARRTGEGLPGTSISDLANGMKKRVRPFAT